jgi:dTDP-4-dehydrorhamnose 3,5-epimerase
MRSASIADVVVHELTPHVDSRGRFTEIYRESWNTRPSYVQWNCVQSDARVLRGVHVHAVHDDYLVVAAGTLVLGLHDIRPESATRGRSEIIIIEAGQPLGVAIPPGVCHGFYFPVPSVHIYAVSSYWNIEDELGCRFDCPELGLNWPDRTPQLSERDKSAGDYAQMCQEFARASAHSAAGETR